MKLVGHSKCSYCEELYPDDQTTYCCDFHDDDQFCSQMCAELYHQELLIQAESLTER